MNNFQDKVVYQIYIKSFKDSNGDGIGDLKGVTEKLDYLKELGVDYIWITPFYASPLNDNGYDIMDYYQVDPLFGTMEDLENLIAQGKKRGISLMTDLVFNHTSTKHEWFQKALAGDEEYQKYYIFKEGEFGEPPTNWVSKFGGSTWEYVPHLKKWYLHLFDKTQADLNWENPKVREELKEVVKFWRGKGVEGFRFDVINLISKPENFQNDTIGDGRRFYTDGPKIHEYLKELVKDTGIRELMTVGEMSSTSIEDCIRYSNPKEEELTMCFSFHHLKVDYKNQDKWEIMEPDLIELQKIFRNWQLGMQKGGGWNALFWCNHDQPRSVSRFGDDKAYWLESSKMLATFLHLLRGTPYIYQGEEIGMTNGYFISIEEYKDVESINYYQIMIEEGKTKEEALKILRERSRDNGRTPMQWNQEKFYGFSQVKPWIPFGKYEYPITAEEQVGKEGSIFSYYQELIRLRKERSAISRGEITFFDETPGIIGYKRRNNQEEILVFCNFTNQDLSLKTQWKKDDFFVLLQNYVKLEENGKRNSLRPYETLVLLAES
ncbi:trehalose-6-phosphate hydrolase [Aequitasia blattaphilus]|uniref:Alpha,alpha-phosphotrehalase n=1 Tax=Aequitasia blattaphilus TaxID=2949332 RepID=A0ABT1E561_9FIRM|nr:alpha,alpha-phosphotrehalase [Aequitasia blattaphilus]MCP1100981.1 alpha,alpha-phosphotrehalase [Aequitasia blattaphilus]MCR8613621.1 alpha,alpha-phosphotrehalase [Aequitasia blattaphilus]